MANPQVSPELVTAGRQDQTERLAQWFRGEPSHYYVQGDTQDEAIAFLAGCARADTEPTGSALPGDLIEVDTLDVRPLPGIVLKHCTGRDLASRWDVVAVYTRTTATTATSFLGHLIDRMPFEVRAIQSLPRTRYGVDGGSEFAADFERECERRGVRLFVLPHALPISTVTSSVRRGLTPRSSTRYTTETYRSDLSNVSYVDGSRSTTPSGHTSPSTT